MGAFFQYSLLFVCWLAALATLLVFLESWFALSGRNRFVARRASGAYGVVSVFVPMRGSIAKAERTIRSIFEQSYPFIELFLIYPEEEQRFPNLAKEFRAARSHIPVRLVTLSFPIDSGAGRTRALEQAHSGARGRWLVIVEPGLNLDRFAIETALEFAGSNEISALALRPGVQCRSLVQRLIAPSMEHLLQMVRIVNRRRERRKTMNLESSFLLLNREAFDVVNRVNRMPGILNESGWSIWSYEVEGLRTFEADGSRWIWRDADIRSWSSDTEPVRRFGRCSAALVAGSAIMTLVTIIGLAYGFTHRIDNFAGASILAFSAVSYVLMAISYLLYARRLRAAQWFAPVWFLSHLPAAVLTLIAHQRQNTNKTYIHIEREALHGNYPKKPSSRSRFL